MLLDHGHQEMQIPTAKKAKGTHGFTCYLWVTLPGASIFCCIRRTFSPVWILCELQGRLGASRIGEGMAQSTLEVMKNSFANLLLANHCRVQYLEWQQQTEGFKPKVKRPSSIVPISKTCHWSVHRWVYMGGTTMKPPFSRIALMNPHSMKMTSWTKEPSRSSQGNAGDWNEAIHWGLGS